MADSASTVTETIDAWRARGADRLDPVRLRFIEALAQRATAHEGEARRLLDERLTHLLAVYEADLAKTAEAKKKTSPATPAASGLAELLAHVAERTGIAEGSATAGTSDLKSLRYFRSTWSRLSLEQQLARALAQAPDNAGPLNSHFLVLQALIRMRDIAPQYLEGFIAHVDALFWLERADPGRGAVGRGAAPKAGARKGEARARGGRTRRQSRGAEG